MVASISGARDVPLPEYALRLLRAVPDAAVFVSAQGYVLAANAPARDALNLDSERPLECSLAALVDDEPEKFGTTLRTWSRSTQPLPGAFRVKSDSGPKAFNGKGCVIFSSTGEDPAVLLVRFWPRSEANPFLLLNQKIAQLNDEAVRRLRVEEALRRSEHALRERVAEAEALNRAKDEFLATVSHELRTPLSAILGWSSLLRGRVADVEAKKALEVIHRNAESQKKLIEDILDVSRIITGKLLLETQPTDLAAIVEGAVEVVRPSAAAKEIAIEIVRPAEACLLIADPDRLRQVVWNLLSNAVKFTPRGGSVHLQIERRDSQYALTVVDTGKGIEPSFLPFVFDRFRQADSSTTRRLGGLGLGLALVRHIVELHGGSVQALSEGADRGTTFVVSFPVRAITSATVVFEPPVDAAEVVRAPPATVRLQDVRVLVVDDEADARDLLTVVLRQAGAVVDTAHSAGAALQAVAASPPHVIVSDIGMPDEDGYSFIQRLRGLASGSGGAIPSIALTAYTRAEDRNKALAAGFTTHIGKPVEPEDLIAAIANLAVFARN